MRDLFGKVAEYYHVTGVENDLICVADDCPEERIEELKKVDAEYYAECGKHLFDIFADKQESESTM